MAVGVAVGLAVSIPGAASANAGHHHSDHPADSGTKPNHMRSSQAAFGPPSGAPCSVGEGVVACFVAAGDVFWVKDKRADGYHVDAVWSPNGHDNNFCHNRHGSDAGWTYCDGFADDIPENSEIVFRAGVFDSDHGVVGDGSWGAELVVPTS